MPSPIINTDQSIPVSVSPKTAAGADANIDGDAVFSTSPSGRGSFERVSATSAIFTPSGVGPLQIKAEIDADLDEGETRKLTAYGSLVVINPEEEATTFSVDFGQPESN